MILKTIKIKNFKGVASFEKDFDSKLTQLKGPSSSSKTTILDAIKWCLGYPIKNWEPTTSQDRVKVPDIITDIKLTLECNGSQYVIKSTWKGSHIDNFIRFKIYINGVNDVTKQESELFATLSEAEEALKKLEE